MNRLCMKSTRTVCVYGMAVFAAIVLTLALRTVSLIWLHDLRPMGASPWILLRRGLRTALIVAPIQTPILLLGMLLGTRRDADKRRRCTVLATIVLCFLNLFIRPISIWTDANTTIFFCTAIGFAPAAVLVSLVVFRSRWSTASAHL